ncbi:type-1 restriction enzyme EcoKI specificity protein [Pseudomonas sp. DD1]|uniref:restriction endonuclease subunit S n=1 Tax=Pseudomonas sp. DD1 TaxID=879558 RepID=UPI0037CB7389
MNLPSDWVTCKFEDLLAAEPNALADGPFGSALKSSDYTETGCRVIRLNNVGVGVFLGENKAFIEMQRIADLKRHEAKPGDLITAALGDPLGRTCQVPIDIGPAIVKADCFRSRLHKRIDSELIKFWLNSNILARYFDENSKGVGRVRITLSVLRNAIIPLPPEKEQKRLVIKLRSILDRSAIAKSEAQRASTAATALKVSGLRSGVTGLLTNKWRDKEPSVETAAQLLARVAPPQQARGGRQATEVKMLGVAGIAVNTPDIEIPEGWSWTPLYLVARQETGHTPSRQHPEYWDGDIGWLGIKDARIHHGSVINKTIQKITSAGLAGSSARILPAGTVCLSRTASVGYVTILGTPMATSQDFVTWTCTPALLPEYLMYALMAEGKSIRRFGRGSTHTTIYFPELRALNIALPPIREQNEIVARLNRLLQHADNLKKQADRSIKAAEDLASKSITHAMSGKFSVSSSDNSEVTALLRTISEEREATGKRRKKMEITEASLNNHATELSSGSNLREEKALTLRSIVLKVGGTISPKALWKRTDLTIEEFYRCLRDEVNAGQIHESEDKEHLHAH